MRLDIRDVDPRVRQQRPGLRVGEREVRRTDLEELASHAEPCQRERGLFAACEHEQRAWRDVQRKGVDHVEGARVRERMDVVEHDDHRGFQRRDRRAEPRDRCRPQRVSPGRHATEHSSVDGLDSVQRRRDVAEEHDRVVVGVVERHPDERPHVLVRPLGEQRRLAVPGRRRDADVARLGCSRGVARRAASGAASPAAAPELRASTGTGRRRPSRPTPWRGPGPPRVRAAARSSDRRAVPSDLPDPRRQYFRVSG